MSFARQFGVEYFHRRIEEYLLQSPPQSPSQSPSPIASHSLGKTFCALALALLSFAPALQAQASHPSSSKPAAASSTAAQPAPPSAPALAIGKADTALLDWILAHSGPLHGDTVAGDYRIAYALTAAEGWWDNAGDGKLAWHDAPPNQLHLRVFVLDRNDGRLLPNLVVRATLTDANGNRLPAPLDFGWYPLLNAYGADLALPGSGYTLRVAVEGESFFPPRITHPLPSSVTVTRTICEFPPIELAPDAVAQLPLATTLQADNEQLLLKPLIEALSSAITALWQQSAAGEEKPVGDYFIGYALEDNASHHGVKNLIDFSSTTNVRLDLLVRDSRTGRLLAGLEPQADLTAADGTHLGPDDLPPLARPALALYGAGLRLPRKGTYGLHLSFEAPGFRRWGHTSERFAESAEIDFEGISLQVEVPKEVPRNEEPKQEPKPADTAKP